MEAQLSLVDRAAGTIEPKAKKLATKVTTKSFVKIACLIAPELPIGFTSGMLVTLNGRSVAAYPGKIRRFPSRTP